MTNPSDRGAAEQPFKLDRDDVHRIAGDAGRDHSPPLSVVGVTGDAESAYAEVVFAGGDQPIGAPILIGVFRDSSEETLRAAVKQKLDTIENAPAIGSGSSRVPRRSTETTPG